MLKRIPQAVKDAAAVAFIRTTAQSYSTAFAGGLTTAIVSDAVEKAQDGNWQPLLISAAVTVLSPLLAGVVAWFQWIAKGLEGIPSAYEAAAVQAVDERIHGH